MIETILNIVFEMAILVFTLFSIVYGFGVVWRVELNLDVSFKYFLAAIISFFLFELTGFLDLSDSAFLALAPLLLKFLFAALLLAGMVTMRDIVRKIDDEKSHLRPSKAPASTGKNAKI